MFRAARSPRPLLLCVWLCTLASACQRETARRAAPARAAPTVSGNAADPALSHLTAAELVRAFDQAGGAASVEGTTVRIGAHTVGVTTSVGSVQRGPDHTVAGIEVRLAPDGVASEPLHVAAVAFDANRDEALAHAVREWGVAYARPIVRGLFALWGAAPASGGATTETPLALGPFRVFAGPTGVHGEQLPPGWEGGAPSIHAGMLGAFAPSLATLVPGVPGGLHSLAMTLHVHDGASDAGTCRVDGRPNEVLCSIARRYPWPAGPSDFVLRQFYVLVGPNS